MVRITAASLNGILLCMLTTGAAFAVDGVILIDQNRALAGGITPGDTAGFPILITQPGSYRLSSNLLVPANTDGIQVSASDVTLDLNGFEIKSPQFVCTATPCDYPFGVKIGLFSEVTSVTVRNGTITGFSFQLYVNGNRSLIENLIIYRQPGGNAFGTNALGQNSIIRNVIFDQAIGITCPSIIVNTIAARFSTDGTAAACVFRDIIGNVF